MNVAEAFDHAAKILTIVSTALYLLKYIDAGMFLSAVAAAAALMSTVLFHKMGGKLKKLAAMRRKQHLHRLRSTTDEKMETFGTPAEILEKLLHNLLEIHHQLEAVAAEKMASKTPARDMVAIAKARLEVIVKIKDIALALEKFRPSTAEKDLSELLRELVDGRSTPQSP
ncbi:MAG: hypothetical protein N3H84_01795 [Candidatus Caldarchaeum sp.]|nr:hypothetical protein [Candidatus Caldarchaeum sp.]MCX8200823.1 hypothetical protein [Candidatus Caldarchaeum sp.]MDW8434805.1 hypothetical protein [Candidatus Caldarchaeum sp.]